ncbi:hypothetical protein [Oceanidesulfovibrio marinus]|uniref:hypothetical protein n=1 Tax=Oceanidesulfovibrio marinus TaxID=370038 RepID=UPI0011833E75|nr:hypothetical protein [Oceanidesulfovibrio marinus]
MPPGRQRIEYRRVVGGIGWPRMGANGAGYWCILGEERMPDALTDTHTVRVLASGSDDSVAMLLDEATMAASALHCGRWSAPTNEPGMRLYIEWQRNRRKLAQPCISLAHPPNQDFAVLWELLKARTKGAKALVFGEQGEELGASLRELDAADMHSQLSHYPAVAALLHALGTIDLLQPQGAMTRTWHRGRAGY